MSKLIFGVSPTLVLLAAMAVCGIPARAQGGGGGGEGGGGGIPLSSMGKIDEPKEKPDPKAASERPVSGVVTDAEGNPVKDAVVHLKDLKTQKVRTAITREKGEYTFNGLNKAVDYQLTAVVNAHASEPHKLTSFDSRPKPVVNLQIK